MRKISILLVMAILLSAMVLSGCGSKTTLYIYTNNADLSNIYTQYANKYVEKNNSIGERDKIEIIVKTVYGDYQSGLIKALSYQEEQPSIFILDNANYDQELADFCYDFTENSLYKDELIDKSYALKSGDKVIAFPLSLDGFGLIYNESIMKRYFDLDNKAVSISKTEEITSFDLLKSVVEDIQKNKDALGIKSAVAPLALRRGYNADVSQNLVGLSLYYEFESASAGFDAASVELKYADNVKNIIDLFVDNTHIDATLLGNLSYVDSAIEFAKGNSAIMMGTNAAWRFISQEEDCVVNSDGVKLMPLYMGINDEQKNSIAVNVGSYIAINGKSDDKVLDLSQKFVNWMLTDPMNIDSVYYDLGYNVPINSVKYKKSYINPIASEIYEYCADDKNKAESAQDAYPVGFDRVVGEMILDYVQGVYDWQGIVATATDAWQR